MEEEKELDICYIDFLKRDFNTQTWQIVRRANFAPDDLNENGIELASMDYAYPLYSELFSTFCTLDTDEAAYKAQLNIFEGCIHDEFYMTEHSYLRLAARLEFDS